MKALSIFILLPFILLLPAFAQQTETSVKSNLKYGKPSIEELTMTTFAPDTTATAVYLFHQGESEFTYMDGFRLITEHWFRIKILKPQGASYADIAIPYYAPSDRDVDKDNASDIDGCSYNMENGECVKTPLKREFISNERINNRFKILKFSLPAVKAGTVIEYHYKLGSDYFAHIDNWMMQEELPILHNQYKACIPSIFIYNIEMRGKDYIDVKEKQGSMHASVSSEAGGTLRNEFSIATRELTFTSLNLPAIRQDEPFCWCPEDHKVQISFDLEGIQYPDREYESYSQKWSDVDKQFTKDENEQFGKYLHFENPYREEVRQNFNSDMSFNERVIAAFHFLKKKLTWDGSLQLNCKDLNKVVKSGSGSNADLNFIFISILRNYGLRAFPAVLSRRSAGILPINFPSLQKLNTFVVAIYDTMERRYVYLDSSMSIPAINVLPSEFSVDRVRLLSPFVAEENKWVNLIEPSPNKIHVQLKATVKDGQVTGHRTTYLQGQHAVEYQKQEKKSEPSNKEGLALSNLNVKIAPDDYTNIEEQCDFTMQANASGQRLYINPMLFPHMTKNPFIQTERTLPVEFPYPYRFNLICTFTLPEGYEVEEMPQSQSVKTEDNNLQCKYLIQKDGNTVQLSYTFSLKSHVIPPWQYKQLQELWTKVINKNEALLVLKKI